MNNLKGNKPKKMPWEVTREEKEGRTELSRSGFYSRAKWMKIRDFVLSQEPLCRECLSNGKVRTARMVDHIRPITPISSEELKYGIENLQPMCFTCHSVKTNRDSGKRSAENLERGKFQMRKLES